LYQGTKDFLELPQGEALGLVVIDMEAEARVEEFPELGASSYAGPSGVETGGSKSGLMPHA
jgi:hypothetical protein